MIDAIVESTKFYSEPNNPNREKVSIVDKVNKKRKGVEGSVDANAGDVGSPSMASTIRAYALPIVLFAGAMFYQLFLIPNSFPPSHYDVLQLERHSSIDKVKEAYAKLEYKWNSIVEVFDTLDFLKHVLESASKQYAEKSISEFEFPLLDPPSVY